MTRFFEGLRALRELGDNPDDTAQVFRIVDALSGKRMRLFRRFRRTPTGARLLRERPSLLAHLQDRERLLALPEGSLGRTYAEFIGREQISADGLVAASEATRDDAEERDPDVRFVGERLRDMHDLWHVVTGYERDLIGEAALLAFTFAQTRNLGIGTIVAYALWKSRGDFAPARPIILEGLRRGWKAQWLPAQDWEALLERPLDEVREQLEVGPPPAYTQVRSDGAPPIAA